MCIHLAGLIDVEEAEKRPDLYYSNNVAATINLITALRQFQNSLKHFIFSSTAAVNGRSVYGATKKMCENAIIGLLGNDIDISILRYYNVAGADLDGEMGENHLHETHLIPKILQNKSVHVYGTDYDTHDGTCIRDYVHVMDVANLHVRVLENNLNWLSKRCVSSILWACNIGSGVGYSVNQIIDEIRKHGIDVEVNYSSRRAGDVDELVAPDTEVTYKILDYKLKYNLSDIIKTAIQWECVQKRVAKARCDKTT